MLATAEHYFWLIESHRLKKINKLKAEMGEKHPLKTPLTFVFLVNDSPFSSRFLTSSPCQKELHVSISEAPGITVALAIKHFNK